ncbi:MAG TPA: isochorismate synthase [Bacillota bacterium]|nr:isochorismate synthase [Bacillota bacterium]
MIDTKEEMFVSLIKKAKQKNNERQLVSMTEMVNDLSIIHFFEAAKYMNENRYFWMSAAKDFSFAGVGSAFVSTSDTGDAFEQTKNCWEQLVRDAVIHNPYKEKGTGIVNVGGFTFDPKKPKTDVWKDYADGHFVIPTFLLTKVNGKTYLTTTIRVTEEMDSNQVVEDLSVKASRLMSERVNLPKQAEVIQKNELAVSEWSETVKRARKEIRLQRAKKIVIAREMRIQMNKGAEISTLLNELINNQSDCYIFAYEQNDSCFVGATPERLVKITGDELLSTCLAGTFPRGKTIEEDLMIRNNLLHDAKNLEEHAYVVDMIRKSITPYCATVHIEKKPVVLPLKNLQHLYTPVKARLKRTTSVLDIVKRLHPTPALGGEPADVSLSFIREYESLDRGWYGAPIGWMDSNANSEFIVAIRSGLFQGNEASLFAGGGIMKDSEMDLEYEETIVKFSPMLQAMGDKG